MNELQIALNHYNSTKNDDRIFVRVASQVSLNVSGDGIFEELQKRVLKWVFSPKRNVARPPEGAWEGDSFEIDSDHSERVAAISLDQPRYWALRLSERLKDPNRVWTTEIGIGQIAENQNEVAFGCRLLCTEKGIPIATPRSIPSFVRGIVFTQKVLLDGMEQSADPWIVGDIKEARKLISFLQSPNRKHPVVIFSLPEESKDPEQTIISVKTFIRRTAGYVHSVIITQEVSFFLTDVLGRDYTVYRQAIRTFNPGFSPDQDRSSEHPLATAERIMNWAQDHEEPFDSFLVNQSLRITRPRKELENEFPPFQQIKRLAAASARKTARQTGKSDAELLMLAEEEIQAAKKETQETLDLLTLAEQEREDALSKARDVQASYMALQYRVEHLQQQLQNSPEQESKLPETLTDLGDWATENLAGFVILHERAIKAARSSDFQNTELIYKVLLLIRDYYVPMKRKGGNDLRAAFENELAALGLENTRCFAQKNKAKNYGGAYFVRYQGESRELDWHLKGSSSRDERYGLRLYYFWDDASSQVVVGYLPGHLKTDIS